MRNVKNIVNEQKLTSQLTEISQCYNGLTNLILKMENSAYTIQGRSQKKIERGAKFLQLLM